MLWESSDATFTGNENNNLSVSVVPNPASENVMVEWNGLVIANTTIDLINEMGQIVYSATVSKDHHQHNLTVHDLPQGIYSLRIISGKYVKLTKISIQR
ncbi:MAG: T9SS type A sorting domain-containing protein [Chitinophagales bacterium]|nr:T9SS type A sorting domain-containing protein [Chitinophagales bacterium]